MGRLCYHVSMNKEEFISSAEQVRQPLVVEPGVLRRYNEADFRPFELRRLAEVREEIATLPMINVFVQNGEVPQKPNLFLMFLGALLMLTGEVLESAGENKS